MAAGVLTLLVLMLFVNVTLSIARTTKALASKSTTKAVPPREGALKLIFLNLMVLPVEFSVLGCTMRVGNAKPLPDRPAKFSNEKECDPLGWPPSSTKPLVFTTHGCEMTSPTGSKTFVFEAAALVNTVVALNGGPAGVAGT